MEKHQHIHDNGGWDGWNMIKIEKHPCNDKRDAEARGSYSCLTKAFFPE